MADDAANDNSEPNAFLEVAREMARAQLKFSDPNRVYTLEEVLSGSGLQATGEKIGGSPVFEFK